MTDVNIDVKARIDDTALNRGVAQLNQRFQNAGRDAGKGFNTEFADAVDRAVNRANRALDSTTSATERLNRAELRYQRALKSGDRERIARETERLAKAYRSAATEHSRLTKTMSESAGHTRNFTDALDGAIKAANNLGSSTRFVASGVGLMIAPVVVQGIMDLAKVTVTAAQSVALLPAAVSSAAAAFGTLKIATSGFGEAMESLRDPEKFAEALQPLSPAAQQTALSIQALLPQLDALRWATQETLFAGMGEQVNRLTTEMLPTVQRATTGIADSFNLMAKTAINELLTPANAAQIQTALNNIATSFRELSPAAGSLVQAFVDLTTTGSSFLPVMAQSISEVAQEFAAFIREAQQSGSLEQFMRDGIDAAKALADAVMVVGGFIYDVFGSNGQQNIADFNDTLEAMRTILGMLSGDFSSLSADLEEEFGKMTGFAATFRDAVLDIPEALATVGNVAIDMANSVKHGLDFMGQNFTNFMNNILPGEDRTFTPLPDIPRLPVGDWAGYTPPAFEPPERTGGTYRDRYGNERRIPTPSNGGPPYNGPFPVPAPPARGGGGSETGPQVPFTGDPMALIQGLPVTSQLYSAAQSVLQAQHERAQEEAELNALIASNTADANEIQKARNELAQAEQDAYEAELRLQEAKTDSTQKFTNQMNSAATSLQDFSLGLENDLGLSRGLGGLVENMIKALLGGVTAPLKMQLQAAAQANTTGARGLVGMATAGNAPTFTGNAPTFTPQGYSSPYQSGGYPGDAALLANVPAGRYSQTGNADLTQGLADCSSAVEDLVNLLDGRPTGGRSMSTHNADEWLQSRGFLPGTMPGAFNVGFNSGHMQATLPGGTPFNWGSDAAAARGGVGGTGAFDPSFTSHYYRPVSGMPSGAPPLYSPANTNPALNSPPSFPGVQPASAQSPYPSAGPINYGTPTPYGQGRSWQPNSGGGIGFGGGASGLAVQAGSMALNGMAPGAGIAAQMGVEAISKMVEQSSKIGGILAQGVMETVEIGGENLSSGWLGRALAGLAGAGMALGNNAGKTEPAAKIQETAEKGGQKAQNMGPMVHIENMNNAAGRDGQGIAKDLAYQAYATGMR